MPDPREAIYDVLKVKFERAKAEEAARAVWEAYERENKIANADYKKQK